MRFSSVLSNNGFAAQMRDLEIQPLAPAQQEFQTSPAPAWTANYTFFLCGGRIHTFTLDNKTPYMGKPRWLWVDDLKIRRLPPLIKFLTTRLHSCAARAHRTEKSARAAARECVFWRREGQVSCWAIRHLPGCIQDVNRSKLIASRNKSTPPQLTALLRGMSGVGVHRFLIQREIPVAPRALIFRRTPKAARPNKTRTPPSSSSEKWRFVSHLRPHASYGARSCVRWCTWFVGIFIILINSLRKFDTRASTV